MIMTERKSRKRKSIFWGMVVLVIFILSLLLSRCSGCRNVTEKQPVGVVDSGEETEIDTEEPELPGKDETENESDDKKETSDTDSENYDNKYKQEDKIQYNNSNDGNDNDQGNDQSDDQGNDQSDDQGNVKIIVKINNKSSVYGEKLKTLDYSVISSNDKSFSLDEKDIELTKEPGMNAGKYKITGKCLNNKCQVIFINGTYTVLKKEISLKADDKKSIYGETQEKLSYTLTEGDIIPGDDLGVVLTKAAGKDVGTYSITGTISNKNYIANFKSGKYNILAREIFLTIEDKSTIYGNPLDKLTYTVTKGKVLPGDDLGVILTKETGREIGKYKITGKIDNKNYVANFKPGSYIITARQMTVSLNDAKTYKGEELVSPTFEISSGSFAFGDNAASVFEVKTDAKYNVIGDYKISLITLNKNYDISSNEATYKVRSKPILPDDPEEGNETPTPTPTPGLPEDDPEEGNETPTPTPTPTPVLPEDSEEGNEIPTPIPTAEAT